MLALQRESITVVVMSDPETESWVRRRSRNFFVEVAPQLAESGWRVAGGLENVPSEIATIRGETPGVLTVSASNHLVVVDAPPGPWRSLQVLRAVRHLLRWSIAADQPALFLHGAALADRQTGLGLCILGPSRAGKSMLSYELLGRDFDWISQDDLCLVQRSDRSLCVLGWPGSLRIRRNALMHLPRLQAIEATLAHPANAPEAGNPAPEARLHLFPEELAQHTGCGIRGEAEVAGICILDQTADENLWKRVTIPEARNALIAAWDVLPERRAGAQADEAVRGKANWADIVFNPGLFEAFGMPDLPRLYALVDTVAATAPAWRIGRKTLLGDQPFPPFDARAL